MKLKVIYVTSSEKLEITVNNFIKDKKIENITFDCNISGFYAYILYKE